ncbi:MAG: hypothetical protein A2600_04340 [Candidatus Lambdaproteobacteria bacterium RIFOXYD1_FULL_56_27]|uniref:Aldehyde dehydrogenase n=1 Tax=Candidatus Lambdaproteobacteria bacterium RIFOXYD2_FULL_56_26 TaxID=1817773 RepID=A0A1F6H3S3_9PROT|nr:MAG: hypothetical protein A2426_02140 [Candidatus Lambdaproteobacteria bacterium RIFOXYC1_FULL_56_13]OGH04984.1 MAG: hypothetical protein A2557_08405 [Candidatus Lambdaproteobacteria bacterium RIFOXYD2_FULL_56_26]OGH09449.1 MAG: hypothetical protein A2600_04340 [Candidatus Lambdaproteobacteria bacterium RIFOXYD1_FULL_56_27]
MQPWVSLFKDQRSAFAQEPYPSAKVRLDRLDRLGALVLGHQGQIEEALSADFSYRCKVETKLAETFVSLEGIKYSKKNLKAWMAPVPRAVSRWFFPSKAEIFYQPKGVVGVIAPWNYPLYLSVGPLTAALAAGNRAMVKLPEGTPLFSALFAKLLGERFDPTEVAPVLGGPEVGAAFSAMPWDHLLFTGSTAVGRAVMAAAAPHLTPLTLELGGKSPAILAPSADPAKAAVKILAAKALNAGQTCIAPDYVLLPQKQLEPFLAALAQAAQTQVGSLEPDRDYSSLVNLKHYQRLERLHQEALAAGAKEVKLLPGPVFLPPKRRIAPVVLLNPPWDSGVMQEEIFGPLLPVLTYQNFGEALEWVNAGPRPLALYLFGPKKTELEATLKGTHSGGVAVNQCLLQVAQDDLPFGGVGPSGMGRYHGPEGFVTFSNPKGVYRQSWLDAGALVRPPYNQRTHWMLRWMIGK